MQQALDILKKYWQHETFREPQEAIIRSVLEGHDTFALMPTGGGKSVCYQVPAMMREGLCIVISPLIALMKDQTESLDKKGIKAIALTGGIPADEISDLLDNCRFGNYKFLYLSPERLQSDWITERIKELPITLVAVDEAHCISQWGHDFRPAYLKISKLRDLLPEVPFLALTASATKQVQDDIIKQLALKKPNIFQKSFARENIAYTVMQAEDKLYRVQQILNKYPEPSIIYVRNRKACHDISAQLQSLGFTATLYHGGLKEKEKEANMRQWMEEKKKVMVATNAFGMGIDKANVKTVIHLHLPENIENYYQEAGRAGRNGDTAFAVLLHNPSDIGMAKSQFLEGLPDKKFLREVYRNLSNYLQIAYGEGINETYPFSLNEFCNRYGLPVVKTYNALQFLDRQGILTLSKEFSESIKVRFLIPGKEVVRYNSLNPADEEIIVTILRNYPGIFDMETEVNAGFICRKAKVPEERLQAVLSRLEQKAIISCRKNGADSNITFNEIREDDLTINRISGFLEKQNAQKKQQLESVIHYISDNTICKSRLILAYFGEEANKDCGICSYCTSKKRGKKASAAIALTILQALAESPRDSRYLESALELTAEETVLALKLLLDNDKIKINTDNLYTLK